VREIFHLVGRKAVFGVRLHIGLHNEGARSKPRRRIGEGFERRGGLRESENRHVMSATLENAYFAVDKAHGLADKKALLYR
jgi:hypothetical protein